MKKVNLLLIALFMFFSTANSQDNQQLKKHYLALYQNAIKYNDAQTAIGALNGYLTIDSSLAYKDTLSMLYFSVKSFYSALILTKELYMADTSNYESMARAAECYFELGDPKTALELFEKVVPNTKNLYYVYKLAIGQYQLKKTTECEASLKKILADTTSKNIGVNFNTMNRGMQRVRLNAAASNLMGILKMESKNFQAAKKYFQEAIKINPDFQAADQNLTNCDKAIKAQSKVPLKPMNKPSE